jgi:hypothetical protein
MDKATTFLYHAFSRTQIVRTQLLKCIHTLFFLTNSYPQERASGQRSSDMKVWKRGHSGSDPSNPDKLCTLMAEARLVSY